MSEFTFSRVENSVCVLRIERGSCGLVILFFGRKYIPEFRESYKNMLILCCIPRLRRHINNGLEKAFGCFEFCSEAMFSIIFVHETFFCLTQE